MRLLAACAVVSAALLTMSACGSADHASTARRVGTGEASGTPRAAAPALPAADGADAHRATIAVSTGAETTGGTIAARYTCSGEDSSPPLRWNMRPGVLAEARELVIVARTLAHDHLVTDWAVAGLHPSVRELRAGKLPRGAVIGRNSFGDDGYEVCLPTGRGVVTLAVYALPATVQLKPGFPPQALLEVIEAPGVQWGSAILGISGGAARTLN